MNAKLFAFGGLILDGMMKYIFNMGVPSLYRDLPRPVQQKLEAVGYVSRYQDGQHIQSRGDDRAGLSIISSGAVCFGKNDAEGRFMASATFEAGHSYGEFTLFANLPRTHDAFAVGDTNILDIAKDRFDHLLAEEPALVAALLAGLTMRLHGALEWVDDLRRYPLKYRLGKNLLQMTENAGTARLDITQSEMADLMGVSRVAIGKIITGYKKDGFVTQRYGFVEIVDVEAMQRWLAGFVQLDSVAPPQMTALGATPPIQ